MDPGVIALVLGYASLACLLIGIACIVYARAKTRASLLHDVVLRTTGAFVLVQGVVLYANHTTAEEGSTWLLVEGVLIVISAWLAVPAIFLACSAEVSDGYVILSRGVVEGLHVKLDKMYGSGAAHLIAYNVGKEAGRKDLSRAAGARFLPERLLWRALPYIFRSTGYGRLRYAAFEPGREVRLTLRGSMEAFPEEHDDGPPGTCDLTRGYLAGMGKALHPELECHAEETRCSHGDPASSCEFVIRWFEPMKPAPGA